MPLTPASTTVRSPVSIRRAAVLLVLAAAVPLLLFGGITVWWTAQRHAETFTQAQTDAARMLASTVDAELHAWKSVLAALAQSPALQGGDLKAFYDEAKAVSRSTTA